MKPIYFFKQKKLSDQKDTYGFATKGSLQYHSSVGTLDACLEHANTQTRNCCSPYIGQPGVHQSVFGPSSQFNKLVQSNLLTFRLLQCCNLGCPSLKDMHATHVLLEMNQTATTYCRLLAVFRNHCPKAPKKKNSLLLLPQVRLPPVA